MKPEDQRILVTGAAGFIGMHACLELHKRGYRVLGIDNLNEYYDISLKMARLALLTEIEFTKVDVCDLDGLRALFRTHQFTTVLHLAAQAGVRYSIENPYTYIRNNLMGFVTVLDVIKEFNQGKLGPQNDHADQKPDVPCALVYASSSSVYGRNKKAPFDVMDPINLLSSLYAATKKSNEDIAQVYNHLHKIKVTGLRFFTVYGPLGRPDMAIYSFTNAIVNGNPIKVYCKGELLRDFTYIEDVVSGIVKSIELRADNALFNLGKGSPDTVNDLISYIEKCTGQTAKRLELPMQPGDVPLTFADITHTTEVLGYVPTTSLREGVEKFCKWYLSFHQK